MTTPQPPAPLTDMKLTDEIKSALGDPFGSGNFSIISYVDGSGQPNLSFRGSIHVHGDKQLALWARNPEGGLLKALKKRPVTLDRVEAAADEIEATLRGRGDAEVPSTEIGRLATEALRDLDQLAYIRFASVYHAYDDIETLRREVDRLPDDDVDRPAREEAELLAVAREDLLRAPVGGGHERDAAL